MTGLAPARDGSESICIQSIEREIDAPDTGREKLIRITDKLRAIGGQLQFTQATRPDALPQAADQGQHILAHQRLTTRQPDLVNTGRDEGGGEAFQFLKRQDFRLGQEGHVFRHAIDAAQIAAISHLDAQIRNVAPERIHERRGLRSDSVHRQGLGRSGVRCKNPWGVFAASARGENTPIFRLIAFSEPPSAKAWLENASR